MRTSLGPWVFVAYVPTQLHPPHLYIPPVFVPRAISTPFLPYPLCVCPQGHLNSLLAYPLCVCPQGHLSSLLALSCFLSSHFRFVSSYSFAFSRPLEHDLPGLQGSCALWEKTFYTILQHAFIPLQSASHLNSLIVLTFGPQYFSLPLFFLPFQ